MLSLFALPAFCAPADAAFPGKNGKIAFYSDRSGNYEIYTVNPDGSDLTQITHNSSASSGDPKWSSDGKKFVFHSKPSGGFFDVWTMNADGTNQTNLTNSPATTDGAPGWSPDGRKIVFVSDRDGGDEIYTMNADGTGVTKLTSPGGGQGPAWSPDGSKIAFYTYGGSTGLNVFVMNADGTNQTDLTPNRSAYKPSWSPDGSKIAFVSSSEIYTMNADGTNKTQLTSNFVPDYDPAWSPDGTKIAFISRPNTATGELMTMNADGTNVTRLTNDSFDDARPDWQPLQATYSPTGYPRPKGATPFQTYLTVAYLPCAAADRQHGAPLAALSCNPPLQASSYLTVGTLDSNGQKANSIGIYRLDVQPGSSSTPTDVKITFALSDVRNKADLSDYTGELRVTENWRITDHDSGPVGGPAGSDPATVNDLDFPPVDIACAATADTTIGSTCDALTSANAIVPGSIQPGKRMIGQLDQVQVHDGGADGVAATETDNTLFLDEGIFVP